MKKLVFCGLIAILAAICAAAPVVASDTAMSPTGAAVNKEGPKEVSGEAIIVDALVLRPLGFTALAVGVCVSVVAVPIAAISHTTDDVGNAIIVKPFKYTFTRPMGRIDSVD